MKLVEKLRGAGDTVFTMTDEDRADCLAVGCDPTCHACKKLIAVGERWRLGPATLVDYGGRVSAVRAMTCLACAEAGQFQSTEATATEARDRLEASSESTEAIQGRRRYGCLFVDGRLL